MGFGDTSTGKFVECGLLNNLVQTAKFYLGEVSLFDFLFMFAFASMINCSWEVAWGKNFYSAIVCVFNDLFI